MQKQMEKGVYYNLDPPAVIQEKGSTERKVFKRVMCEHDVPKHPGEYVVNGIPEGGTKSESFVLIFSGNGRIVPNESKDQTPTRSQIRLVRD